MTINPTEISDIIKDKIKNLDIKTQSHNEGTVVSLTDGIARIYGITDALQGEMLEFPNNIYGLALNLERDCAIPGTFLSHHVCRQGLRQRGGRGGPDPPNNFGGGYRPPQ